MYIVELYSGSLFSSHELTKEGLYGVMIMGGLLEDFKYFRFKLTVKNKVSKGTYIQVNDYPKYSPWESGWNTYFTKISGIKKLKKYSCIIKVGDNSVFCTFNTKDFLSGVLLICKINKLNIVNHVLHLHDRDDDWCNITNFL